MNSPSDSASEQNRGQKIEAVRPPFNETFLKNADEFVSSTLRDVPELGGLAIVPIWENPTDTLPPAILRMRNPDEPPMAGVLQLVQNMSKFSLLLNKTLIEQYTYFARRVHELSEQFEEIKKGVNDAPENT